MTTTDLERQTYFERMPVGRIHPDPINPRKNVTVDDDFLTSIRAGIIEPLVVRPNPNAPALIDGMDGEFLIIAGHRRHLGATTIELEHVPVRVIYDLEDADVLEMMLVENQQRQNLSPLEEAEAYEKLVQLGRTQRDIAKHVGREQGTVSKRLSLLRLPERARVLLDSGTISVKTALGMTGLVKHNDRLARVLDFASMSADGDDRLIAQRVHRELESVLRDKERAKNPPDKPEPNGADRKLPIEDPQTGTGPAVTDEMQNLAADRIAARDAEHTRKVIAENLLADGYPGDDEALAFAARLFTVDYIAISEQDDLALLVIPEHAGDEWEDDELEAALVEAANDNTARTALAAALMCGENSYEHGVRRQHLAFLMNHGYQLQLPDEHKLFDGITTIDLTGSELADKNAEVNAAPASPDTEPSVVEVASTDPQSPDHQGDEATEGAATSAAPTLPWKGYKGHTPKMINNILRSKDAEGLANVICWERDHENRPDIIECAEGRLAEMEADHQARNGAAG